MKLSRIALFLGCAAIFGWSAVQSDFFHFDGPAHIPFPKARLTLAHLWLEFPHASSEPEPSTQTTEEGDTTSPVNTLLSKAETLLLIDGAAARHQVPAAFIASIVAAESNFNCAAISPKGAIGLMQLMPETAKQFGADPAVPAENIDAGTRYLRWLMERYQKRRNSINHVIAAYNAGPAMVDRYRGIPPFRETRMYVARVLGFLKQFSLSGKRDAAITDVARNAPPQHSRAIAD
jgi:transglycosylase-like protein with SLT domain